jgi:hypothetical protein
MSSRSSRNSVPTRKPSRAASISSVVSGGVEPVRGSGGAGNLADELGQVWGDEEDNGDDLLEALGEDEAGGHLDLQTAYEMNDLHDFGYGVTMQSPLTQDDLILQPRISNTLAPPISPVRQTNHKRMDSAYDGSDYGPESDYEDQCEGLPPILRKRMREIDRLSRDGQHTDDTVSEGGGVMKRTIAALRDLGPPQSNIEYGVTRMVTAYTSMATHRSHKQREVFAQSHSLLYNNTAMLLPEEFIDVLIDELSTLAMSIPFLPAQNPLLSLQILASQTSELTHTLRGLTDLLQETKVAANAATRKLKSVKDMVDDLQVEEELVENSIMIIQAQDWDRRLRERHAAKACREVVEGFAERWGVEITPKSGEITATA